LREKPFIKSNLIGGGFNRLRTTTKAHNIRKMLNAFIQKLKANR
jgi:hypothetical protein